jgi:hypothetical protein
MEKGGEKDTDSRRISSDSKVVFLVMGSEAAGVTRRFLEIPQVSFPTLPPPFYCYYYSTTHSFLFASIFSFRSQILP